MTSAIAPTTNTTGLYQPQSQASTPLSEANASQDRFLKLLVAQMNNQDPMNPMDNAQMTSQMAQINTVSGINQLNETMKSLGSQFNAMQVLQGASLVGHDVLLSGNRLSVDNGVAKGAFDLSSNADNVSVEVRSPGGQLLDTMTLGPRSAGRQNFEWNASNYAGMGNPTFKVIATKGTQAVATTPFIRDTIVSVSNSGSGMSLQLKGRDPVAYDTIQSIM